MQNAPAALDALRPVPFVGQEMLQSRQKKRAKATALGVESLEIILFKEAGEERLGQVLGVLPGMATPPHVGVERKPIGTAQFIERPSRLWRGTPPGREPQRPP